MDLALDSAKRPTRRLARVLAPLAVEYDFVFLDCPPSISLVSESVFEAADALLVPLIPATLSSRTLAQLEAVLDDEADSPPRLLPFFSMVDARKRLHRDVMEQIAAEHHGVLDAAIPAASDVERMGVHRNVVAEFAPRSRAARAYADLWREVEGRLGPAG
jgi:cellulose biosynthesis protein BcsQ